MKLGTRVEHVQPRIIGEVVDVKWNAEQAEPECLVMLDSGAQRWFLNSQLTVVEGEQNAA